MPFIAFMIIKIITLLIGLFTFYFLISFTSSRATLIMPTLMAFRARRAHFGRKLEVKMMRAGELPSYRH